MRTAHRAIRGRHRPQQPFHFGVIKGRVDHPQMEWLLRAVAGTALVTYLSSLCSPAFTATQYALLSSITLLGRTVVASSGGILSEKIGWVRFFLLTSVVGLPALILFLWIGPRDDFSKNQRNSDLTTTDIE